MNSSELYLVATTDLGQRMADTLADYISDCGRCRYLTGDTKGPRCERCLSAEQLLDEWEIT